MRNSSRIFSAALAATLLLLFWTTRRSAAPELVRNGAAHAPAPAEPLPDAPAGLSAPEPSSPRIAVSAIDAADRLELVRRCLRLAETDPLAAMDLAIAQKLTADDPGLLNALILRWADQDFSSALEWARVQPRDAGRDDILAHLAFHQSSRNPAAAAEIAATEIVGARARAEAILSVAHQWAQQNASAALAWSANLADADLRRRVQEDIAATQARNQAALSVP